MAPGAAIETKGGYVMRQLLSAIHLEFTPQRNAGSPGLDRKWGSNGLHTNFPFTTQETIWEVIVNL